MIFVIWIAVRDACAKSKHAIVTTNASRTANFLMHKKSATKN
jgi:hypothetical protein